MFREYLGINPVIVAWQMFVMLFVYSIFSKYLAGSITNEIDCVLNETEEEDGQGASEIELSEMNPSLNKIVPSTQADAGSEGELS